jgi:putative transposase
LIDKDSEGISVRRQCQLVSVNRSKLYYASQAKRNDAELCQETMEIYEKYPIYGYRRITAILRRQGLKVNKKRIQRLMSLLGLKAIYPGPNTSRRNHAEMVYPYLLKGLSVVKLHQVWQIDISYLRVEGGFVYLVALIDVYSRMVVSWRLSNDLANDSALDILDDAISKYGIPEIINSDQGAQFTSSFWIDALAKYQIKISMTGKGRSNDNAYVERLWRTLKYEGIYLHGYKTIKELKRELPNLINWYNFERPHSALNYLTPGEKADAFMDKLLHNLPTTTQPLQQLIFLK